jgi:hypothetical protein
MKSLLNIYKKIWKKELQKNEAQIGLIEEENSEVKCDDGS